MHLNTRIELHELLTTIGNPQDNDHSINFFNCHFPYDYSDVGLADFKKLLHAPQSLAYIKVNL